MKEMASTTWQRLWRSHNQAKDLLNFFSHKKKLTTAQDHVQVGGQQASPQPIAVNLRIDSKFITRIPCTIHGLLA
ncbi:hypothetical protein CSV69_16355 [Sporosarcina sp. P26b]|uniref:hypothetical protein n=1 Tax=Sporosarcina sp. P26b TaxID=2048253 RepID=UPI000C171665|nr:hypothetical protein [Sporosarcina sp. P26b]PIC94512.1 hypothetical protein CSV69_16355 [Sporosarcina sp. P26b]